MSSMSMAANYKWILNSNKSEEDKRLSLVKTTLKNFSKKLEEAHKKKEKLWKKLPSSLKNIDYDKCISILKEYLDITQKTQLPYTKNTISFINNQFALLGRYAAKNKISVSKAVEKARLFYREIQKLMMTRVEELEDEVKILDECISSGVSLQKLVDLKKDEKDEKILDKQFETATDIFKKFSLHVEENVYKKLYAIHDHLKDFEKDHKILSKADKGVKLTTEYLAKSSKTVEEADGILIIMELALIPAIALVAAPIVGPVTAIVGGGLMGVGALAHATAVNNTMRELVEKIRERMKIILGKPDIDIDLYNRVYATYSPSLI